jgi:N-acetylglucosaminyldiphosphoundecaprenol N-acetyl-beta-D-mannosaminyltransferase
MRIVRTNTLGIRVDALVNTQDRLSLLNVLSQRQAALFTFVNPGSLAIQKRDRRYGQLLNEFDVVLPDGIGMCRAIRLLHGLRAERVSFDSTSLAPFVFRQACANRLTVALVGGRPGVAERASHQLNSAFPGLAITATLDGYGEFGPKIRALKAQSPSLVVCGMGAGAQERFLISLVATGWSGTGFTCGGYLDQLASGLNYYPKWVDAANLRSAYRLFKEPRRLAYRYLADYTYFALCLGRALISRNEELVGMSGPLVPSSDTHNQLVGRPAGHPEHATRLHR